MKKKILLITVCALIMVSLAACKEKEPEHSVDITTIPLYVDGELYFGNAPLCYIDDVLCVPKVAVGMKDYAAEAFEAKKTKSKETVEVPEDGSVFIEEFEASYLEYSALSSMDQYDCYLNEVPGDYFVLVRNCEKKLNYEWTENRTIAHAMGGVNGVDYTNSLEAFNESYEAGHTVFEVDFALTSDGDLVCVHDFSKEIMTEKYGIDETLYIADEAPTKAEFDELRTKANYTLLDIEDIIELLYNYPEIYIVTDTKENETEKVALEFNRICDAAESLGCDEVLDRIIPQIYDEEMYETIMDFYDWKSIIYTTYYIQDADYDEMEVLNFAYSHGIRVVTMYVSRGTGSFLEALYKRGIMPYVHTYNTEIERQYLYEKGFYGLYTDFLIPD